MALFRSSPEDSEKCRLELEELGYEVIPQPLIDLGTSVRLPRFIINGIPVIVTKAGLWIQTTTYSWSTEVRERLMQLQVVRDDVLGYFTTSIPGAQILLGEPTQNPSQPQEVPVRISDD